MRKVIDSNALQSEELLLFLEQDKENIAVITEYIAIESYKSNNPPASFHILSKYPKQVKILKRTIDLCSTNIRGDKNQDQLIDEQQTKTFDLFCQKLDQFNRDKSKLRRATEKHKLNAEDLIRKIEVDADKLTEGAIESFKLYSDDELKQIRKQCFSTNLYEKIFRHVLNIASELFSSHPNTNQLPEYNVLQYSYLFRSAVCVFAYTLNKIATGDKAKAKASKTRNDIIDLNFITCALYFDGIITADKRLIVTYEKAKNLLNYFSAQYF